VSVEVFAVLDAVWSVDDWLDPVVDWLDPVVWSELEFFALVELHPIETNVAIVKISAIVFAIYLFIVSSFLSGL
jgi:hypothetical protein